MKQFQSGRIKWFSRIIITLFLAITPMFTSAQFFTGLSANAGSSFEGMGYSSSGAGLKLSLGYEVQDWIEIDFQAQRYWLNALSYEHLNSLAINAKIIPFSTAIKPYLGFAGGIGKLSSGNIKLQDQVIVFSFETWQLKPQIGLLIDSGLLENLLVDFNLFYESNKFQDFNGTSFNLYGVNLGLVYKISLK